MFSSADASVAQMVDIVDVRRSVLDADQALDDRDDRLGIQRALVERDVHVHLAVQHITADFAQVITALVEEKAFNEVTRAVLGRRIAGADAAVDVHERIVSVLGVVFLKGRNDLRHFGAGDINRLDAVLIEVRERLFGQDRAFFDQDILRIGNDHILGKRMADEVLGMIAVDGIDLFDAAEGADDVFVRRETENAQERRRKDLAAAVDERVQDVVDVELEFQPCPAVGNDAGGVKRLSVGMDGLLVGHAGRAMQLGHDHAFVAVDDEGAGAGHQRQFAHIDVLLLGLLGALQAHLDLERRRVGKAALKALFQGVLRLAEHVGKEFQTV